MRKVKVNANIAFVIWILEWIANASIVICWVLAPGLTILMAIIWYYIFLPHIFLMNTSHNKDLIVDDGLKTTIMNACKLPFHFTSQSSSTVEDLEAKKEENPNDSPRTNPINGKEESLINFRQKHRIFTITNSPITSKRDTFNLLHWAIVPQKYKTFYICLILFE